MDDILKRMQEKRVQVMKTDARKQNRKIKERYIMKIKTIIKKTVAVIA